MTLTATFIPTQRAKDLLCAIYAEYNRAGETRQLLLDLRVEIGADEFVRFQADLARLLKSNLAKQAMRMIMHAAFQRTDRQQKLKPTKLRHNSEPA